MPQIEYLLLPPAIALWHITEPLSFFETCLTIDAAIKNEKRKIEHLAGRLLLKKLWADFPLENIAKDANEKPILTCGSQHFSISHSFPYATAIMSENTCGIDLQVWHPRMKNLQNKFLSSDEQRLFDEEEKLITMAWCAKEAAYKMMGKRGVDFIKDMPIHSFERKNTHWEFIIHPTAALHPFAIQIVGYLFPDFALTYIL